MIFRRKVYDRLQEWKRQSDGSTALLIEGARRVGKSSIVEEFAKREYETYVLIDFNRPKEGIVDAIVNRPDDLDGLFNLLMVSYGRVLHKRKSLIVFDEVQRCPEARQLIKYLVADGRYDYIETGSLISIRKNVENITIPSEEESVGMFPMDFEEFCWAMGDAVSVDFARKAFLETRPLGSAVHKAVMKRYREYLMVGGMPQAVDAYRKTGDFGNVDRIKRSSSTETTYRSMPALMRRRSGEYTASFRGCSPKRKRSTFSPPLTRTPGCVSTPNRSGGLMSRESST